MEKYDLIIIGLGPGGYTGAIYAARYKMKVLLIGQIPGGYAGTAHDIRNYPGFSKITGMELMMKMQNQAKENGVPIEQDIVTELKKIKKGFLIKTKKKEFECKKLLIATGHERRKLGLPRENDFLGRGISYCATCDAGFYKNKVAGIVGGGDAALTAALLVSKFAKKIYIIYRKGEFTKAEPTWVEDVEEDPKIEVLFNEEVEGLLGESKLEGVKLKSGRDLKLDGLFIEIGGTPNTTLSEELGLKLDKGSIVVDKNQETNVKGVFAAGDVTDRPFRQIVSASGDAATAVYSAFKQIRKERKPIKSQGRKNEN